MVKGASATATSIAQARARVYGKRQDAGARAWLAVPADDIAARLMLIGLVVALQNLLEFPRGPLLSLFGLRGTGVVVTLALAGSLVLLLTALRPQVPEWHWPRLRPVQVAVLLATLAAVPTGLHQLGSIATAGFQPAYYPNDGTTLDHYAAMQVLEGNNPYVSSNLISAVRVLGQDPAYTTPLHQGAFSRWPLTEYPTQQQLRAAFAVESASRPSATSTSFESHVSYPALAFLPLVPLVKLGLPTVEPFFALCFLALALLLLLSVPATLRPWIGLLIIADAPLLDATVAGDLDVLYVLLTFIAWRWWRQPVTSTLALGLSLAAKQLAWFYLPFYVIRVGRELGWHQALRRGAGAGLIFAAINAPFVLNDARAWAAGILAPEVDPMFPLGSGMIRLPLAGILPLWPSGVYGLLELLVLVACIVWYWRAGREMPEAGLVLAIVPLFFAWRSLTTYFYFAALPAVTLLFARQLGSASSDLGSSAEVALAPTGTGRAAWMMAFQRSRLNGWRHEHGE
jgi:hypothetical protein